jgi:ribokinase
VAEGARHRRKRESGRNRDRTVDREEAVPDNARVDLTVIGSANVDLVLDLPRRPLGGETVLAGTLRTTPGGKGANQAVAAARLSDGVRFIGCLGPDARAELLRRSLTDSGVSVEGVRTVDQPTGTAIVLVTPDGENSIVVAPGANAALDSAHVDATAPLWADGAGVLVVQLEIPLATVRHAVRSAAAAGVRVVLNAAPAAQLDPDVLAVADPLVVNRLEANTLLGAVSSDGCHAAAGWLVEELLVLGPRSVVLTLGADGCVFAERGSTPQHVPAFHVTAVDSTGAGDAFTGALAVELARGASLAAAVDLATVVSALSVQKTGAQTSFPTRGALQHLLEQSPPRRAATGPRGRGEGVRS